MSGRPAAEDAGAHGLRCVRAAWVCPISGPPLPGGWVATHRGRIVAVGDARTSPPATPDDLGTVVLLPGLVNAHTHLELAPLRGSVPPAPSLPDWVAALLARRRLGEAPDDDRSQAAIAAALAEMHRAGTAVVGDVSNSLAAVTLLAASPLAGHVFHELIGFSARDDGPVRASRAARARVRATADVRVGIAAHAPYSVSPELLRAVRAEADGLRPPITSIHVGESREEIELLGRGSGAWRELLERLGVWRPDWTPPGCGPVAYLEQLDVLAPGTLLVHGVVLDDDELARAARAGAVVVTCPRSNAWVGAGAPPLARFYAAGVPVAVGTDSLASVRDLNLFAELAAMREVAPALPARRLLESATLVGARALGFEAEYGSLDAGKRAALVAVTLRGNVRDVEEYLVSGVEPSQVWWIA